MVGPPSGRSTGTTRTRAGIGAIGSVGSGTTAGIGVPLAISPSGRRAVPVGVGRAVRRRVGARLEDVVRPARATTSPGRSAGRSGSGRSSRPRSGCGCRCRCRRSPACSRRPGMIELAVEVGLLVAVGRCAATGGRAGGGRACARRRRAGCGTSRGRACSCGRRSTGRPGRRPGGLATGSDAARDSVPAGHTVLGAAGVGRDRRSSC